MRRGFQLAAVVVFVLGSAAGVGAAPPKKLTELPAPAGVSATHVHPLVAAPLGEITAGDLPAYLKGAAVFTRPVGKYKNDAAAGKLEFETTADGPLFLAASYVYDGYAGADRWFPYSFCDAGWVPLAPLTLVNTANNRSEPYTLYLRYCKAGDKFKIHTRLNQPPLLIVLPDAAKAPQLATLEPDPTLPELFQFETVRAKAVALLEAARYDDLDRWTSNYLKDDAHFPSGHYKITETYVAISDFTRNHKPESFVRRIGFLEEWIRQKPDSIAARLMLANCCLRYIVNLRYSSGDADRDVKIDDLRRRTLEVLYEAEQLGSQSPDLYTSLMRLAGEQGWDDDLKMGYVESCIKTGKWCPHVVSTVYYWQRSRQQLPPEKQALRKEKLETLLKLVETHIVPRFGDASYAAAFMDRYVNNPDGVFRDGYVDWPRMKQSFEDLEKHFPGSRRNTLKFLRFACAAGDRPVAQALFDRLGAIDVDEEQIWYEDGPLLSDRAWAAPDFAHGDQRALIETPSMHVGGLDWFPDGKQLLLGANNGFLYGCDPTVGKPAHLLEATVQQPSVVRISPGGGHALVGTFSANLTLVDLVAVTRRNLPVSHKDVTDLRFSPDGGRAIVGFEDGIVFLYDFADDMTKTPVRELNVFDGKRVRAVAFTPDGKDVIVVGAHGTAVVCDYATGAVRRSWVMHTKGCAAAAFSADAAQLVSAGNDNRLSLWAAAEGNRLWEATMTGPRPTIAALSPDGRTLAAGTGSFNRVQPEEIRLYAVADGRPLKSLTGHKAAVLSLSFSPDGRTLASGSQDRSVRLWEVPAE